MLHDLAIVGAGPVGATLALALADADLDVVALDARSAGTAARGNRTLALSHGARLIFERLGVWSGLAVTGSLVIHSEILASERSAWAAAARRTSRSVKIPIRIEPSITIAEPNRPFSM